MRFMKGPVLSPGTHVHPVLVYLLFKEDADFHRHRDLSRPGRGLGGAGAHGAALSRPARSRILLIVASILASTYVLPAVPGFEWLMPVLFLKLVLGFGVREEPYRPAPVNAR